MEPIATITTIRKALPYQHLRTLEPDRQYFPIPGSLDNCENNVNIRTELTIVFLVINTTPGAISLPSPCGVVDGLRTASVYIVS
jgi:hypothetical protein